MTTKIDVKALIALLKKQRNIKAEEKDIAYRFSNGREFERKQNPYSE